MEVVITSIVRIKETGRVYINLADGNQREFGSDAELAEWERSAPHSHEDVALQIALATARKTSPDLSDVSSISGKRISLDTIAIAVSKELAVNAGATVKK